jgi:hypothetical protein
MLLDIAATLGRTFSTVTAVMLLPSLSPAKIGLMIRQVGQTRTHEIESFCQSLKFVEFRCNAGTVQSLYILCAPAMNPFLNAPALIV